MKHKPRSKQSKISLRESVKLCLPDDYAWKVLDTLVHDLDHLLTDNETARLRGIIRNRDYTAYLQLSEEWVPQSIHLHGKTLAESRAVYQVISLLKKYRFPSSDLERKSVAADKFRAAERFCAEYNRVNYIHLACTKDDRMCNVFTYARIFLEKLLGEELPDRAKLTHWSRHGPGANLDTKDGKINQYFKYTDWPYSCTKGALWEARCAIEDDERWKGALEDDYRRKMDIPFHSIIDQGVFYSHVLNVVPGNRIAFVPKNSQTDRSIAIEPSMNLYLQLGVDGYIRRRLKRWNVDLDDQSKNGELARLGSRDWEDPDCYVTLDLAAASDSISLKLCELLLPKQWYNYLCLLRSPTGELGDEVFSYEKISSMGNGFTFALESAIFTAAVYGVLREFKKSVDHSDYAVYGDDIIIKKPYAAAMIETLRLFGFAINSEKSFIEGPFRESCGADWMKGEPVRPVFLTKLPTSVMELWVDLNRLRRILTLRFWVDESKTCSLIEKWIPDRFNSVVGPYSDEQFDSYRHVSKPVSRYTNGMWHYKSLNVKFKEQSAHKFHFRKLMNQLRGKTSSPEQYNPFGMYWKGKLVLTTGGSQFTVTRPGRVTVSLSNSGTSIWCSEYRELLPAERLLRRS